MPALRHRLLAPSCRNIPWRFDGAVARRAVAVLCGGQVLFAWPKRVLAALLVLGPAGDSLIRLVAPKRFMKDEEIAAARAKQATDVSRSGSQAGTGESGGIDATVILAWLAVGI